jgi:hypothetical protein
MLRLMLTRLEMSKHWMRSGKSGEQNCGEECSYGM